MMRFQGPDIPTGRTRTRIDGQWHMVIPLASMEGFAPYIEYPETAGWATTRIGSTRMCAWWPEVRHA